MYEEALYYLREYNTLLPILFEEGFRVNGHVHDGGN